MRISSKVCSSPLLIGLLTLAGIVLLNALAGCGSRPVAPSGGYTDLYRSGAYAEAYSSATQAYLAQTSGKRDDAALIAGLSAQAMNKREDAERWLTPLLKSGDRAMAGRAGAALGLLAQDSRNHQEAARLLEDAGEKLTGDERARAFLYAGDSQRALKKDTEAQALYQRALKAAERDEHVKSVIASRIAGVPPPPRPTTNPAGSGGTRLLADSSTTARDPSRDKSWSGLDSPLWFRSSATGAYTVQAGAFSSRSRATTQANAMKVRANSMGLGVPRVASVQDRGGKTLYAVRVGRFATRQDAERAARSMGSGAIAVHAPGE
ncbi:MAG: SPOR domain-containing protein [Planctomycetota bacterium]|nr:SPOR domain-containing protein [Planctomycetota bacterium]